MHFYTYLIFLSTQQIPGNISVRVENVAAEKLIFKKLFYDYQLKALKLKL
jgi:hypothetical protein